ncbi:MAG: helix-hairpin-helix domain-containing protein [Actinomycetota bacterium]
MARPAANLQVTVAAVAVVILVAGAIWFGPGPDPQPPTAPSVTTTAPVTAMVTIHVSGAVMQPGVVVVPASGRVADALAAAGGAARDADLSRVNLAATIRDGDLITVPSAASPGEASQQPALVGIDLNRSTASQLEGLPGVGPVLAARIVAFREDNGPFTEIEDLLDVPGIGEAKLAGMRDDIASP